MFYIFYFHVAHWVMNCKVIFIFILFGFIVHNPESVCNWLVPKLNKLNESQEEQDFREEMAN